MSESSHSSVFEKIGAKVSFYLGLVVGVGGLFIVGFFVLLGLVFNGGLLSNKSDSGNTNVAQVQPTDPNAAPPVIELTLKKDEWVRGSKKASVSIVEFSDLECPFCKRHHETMVQLMKDYDGKVNWIYRHFPLLSLHPNAEHKAVATECAGSIGGQDGFWNYTDAIFNGDEGGDDAELSAIAKQVGLNTSKFDTCLKEGKLKKEVDEDAKAALAAGGTGTPYNIILVGDQKIPVNGAVPIEQFKQILDQVLKK